LYEENIEFTLPNSINIKKVADLLPNCIKKDQEVIIRDSEMNQLIVVILRNHVAALQQRPLFAAGYLFSEIEHFLSTHDLLRLDGNMCGLCEAYITINYTKHVYIDKNFLKYAWACICGRGLLQNNNNISS
ncbi:15751_t:CDS:2, partial [Funneliformis geosporum]